MTRPRKLLSAAVTLLFLVMLYIFGIDPGAREDWRLYLLVGSGAFVFTLAAVPLCRRWAMKLDIVDRPSDPRKIHARVVPYLGGLPFYLCFLGLILFIEIAVPQFSQPFFFPMCFVGTLIVLMGLYDDIMDMGSLKKLIVELVLMLLLFLWGIRTDEIASPFGGTIQLSWLAFLITPLWIAGIINAINFSDGLDGLAGGLVFICAASIFAISYKEEQFVACIMMAYLMGSTAGFLIHNFHPATVFMGDAGALFLGFVLGTSTLVEQQKGVTVIALAVPMVVMAVPLLDTALSFIRRLQRARMGKFFTPDRDHLHHRLLDLGLTQKQVVLALYYISVCMGLMAFILSVVPPNYTFLILLLAALAIGFGVSVLRFIEALGQQRKQ